MFACSWEAVSQKTHELMRVAPLCLSTGSVPHREQTSSLGFHVVCRSCILRTDKWLLVLALPIWRFLLPRHRLPADSLRRRREQPVPAPVPRRSASPTACASPWAQPVCQLLHSCSVAAKAVRKALQSLHEY